jgi:hypothetical protein
MESDDDIGPVRAVFGWVLMVIAFLLPIASPIFSLVPLPAYAAAKLLKKESWRFWLLYLGWCLLVFGVQFALMKLAGYALKH